MKAIYQHRYGEQEWSVIGKNDDGTVNLGDENGALQIGSCPVSKERKVGHCVLIGGTKDEPKSGGPTKEELMAELDKLGVTYDARKSKESLSELLKETIANTQPPTE